MNRAIAFIIEILDQSARNPIDNGGTALFVFLMGIAACLSLLLLVYYAGTFIVNLL